MNQAAGCVLPGSQGFGEKQGCLQLGCKVNWTLKVLGRRGDGFHELRSWFLGLDGGDRLRWSEGREGLQLIGPEAEGVPRDGSNLVLRADRAWREAGGQAPELSWQLDKQLPPGSGLGAGSADAAGVLQVLQACATQPLDANTCRELAIELGSDLPFFFDGEVAVLLGGRGERRIASAPAPRVWVVIAIPPVAASTPEVFARLQAKPYEPASLLSDPEAAQQGRSDAPTGMPDQPGGNALTSAALQCVPELAELQTQLLDLGAFQLSGSGSAWFCAIPDRSASSEDAIEARERASRLAEKLTELGLRASVHRPWQVSSGDGA